MEEKKFALLIDADNISSKYIKIILEELTKYGTVTYKRLYGDLTRNNNRSWKDALLSHSINPVQQYNYTTGKNSTDSAMIIDAMDILYSKSVDGFCLASSDSDFTRLAMRLRESGMTVIGMGESKTPEPLFPVSVSFIWISLQMKPFRTSRNPSRRTRKKPSLLLQPLNPSSRKSFLKTEMTEPAWISESSEAGLRNMTLHLIHEITDTQSFPNSLNNSVP